MPNSLDGTVRDTIEDLKKGLKELEDEQVKLNTDLIHRNKKAEEELLAIRKQNAKVLEEIKLSSLKRVQLAEERAIKEVNEIAKRNSDLQNSILQERAAQNGKVTQNISKLFLEQQNIYEQKRTELLIQRRLTDNNDLKNMQLFNERRNKILQDQTDLYTTIDSRLNELSLNASSTAAELVKRTAENEKNAEASKKRLDAMLAQNKKNFNLQFTDFFAGLFTLRKGGFDKVKESIKALTPGRQFNSLTNFTDKWGNSRSRLTSKEYKAKMEALLGKNYTNEDLAALNAKFSKAQTNGSWDAYMQAKADYEAAEDGTDLKTQLQKGMEDALKATELDQKEADAAEAAEVQKEATIEGWANATKILANISQKIDQTTEEIAKQKSAIDTRLNGYSGLGTGSQWRKINYDFSALMLSPLIDQKTLMNNLISAVDKGIARDIEQFAVLETIKDKIATTFNVYDSTVLRLIKIQDSNTNAVRLGMEATLNEMLNTMYESTEYLNSIASDVRSSLGEAEALMSDQQSVEFEYQVQKWLGSMYSVGVSQSAVQSLATAIGQLAAGQIEGISSGGASNLLIMAANSGNLSIADILADGLDSSETNVLLNNVVSYMAELVEEANGNNVVQQELAKVFGMTASDLKAATNIISTTHYATGTQESIFNYGGTSNIYNQLLSNLYDMANSMYSRTSVGEMLQNIWSNVQYSTAAGIATNPALYMSLKVADILDSVAGGMEFSIPTVMGTGLASQTWKVSEIMKAASLATGFTQSLATMIASSFSNSGSGLTGAGLLNLVGIDSKVTRGASTSETGSGTIVNASVEDITEGSKTSTLDEANQTTVSAQESSTEVTNTVLNNSILSIKDLLEKVIENGQAIHVKVDGQPIGVKNNMNGWIWG